MTNLPAVYRDGTHSAIVFEIGARAVELIPMETLEFERMRRAEFDLQYEPFDNYPVRRAAEVYLSAGVLKPLSEQVRERLRRIVADKATEYKPFAFNEKATMSLKESSGVPHRRATDLKRRQTDKPVAAKAPAKEPAGKAEVKTKAPAKEPAAKAEVKAKKAPWDTKPANPVEPKGKAKTAPKAEEPAADKKTRGQRSKIEDTVKYKVGDLTSVKRGFIAEFVAKAQEFKKPFTRTDLEALYGGRAADPKMGTYFPYCADKGIFVPA